MHSCLIASYIHKLRWTGPERNRISMRFLLLFLRCCIKRRRALEPRDHRHSQLRDNVAVVALLCTKPSFPGTTRELSAKTGDFYASLPMSTCVPQQ